MWGKSNRKFFYWIIAKPETTDIFHFIWWTDIILFQVFRRIADIFQFRLYVNMHINIWWRKHIHIYIVEIFFAWHLSNHFHEALMDDQKPFHEAGSFSPVLGALYLL